MILHHAYHSFWAIGMNHFMEIAKMRAARYIWSELIAQFKPQNSKSLALRTHSQTSGWSLTEQEPFNNITRTAIEALSSALGGTQSLHTNALDEAIALPTDYSAKIARNTQIILQQESKICDVVDPMGGSYLVESLTQQMIDETMKYIDEVEKEGGMTKAIEAGIPKMRIEEAAAKKQAKIDSSEEFIIGVNSFRTQQKQPQFEILDIDNSLVRQKQIERLEYYKTERDNQAVEQILDEIKECAKTGKGNLLALSIEAARRRATLGEISDALEGEFGRYKAQIKTIQGVYAMNASKNEYFAKAVELTQKFEEYEGRRPRLMVVKMGQDGHDRGAK